ncbi:TetR/AcrR family transcriptional regulator [Nocardia blacklockiae]|uniref:TetR/AcrR family transcriptional regulator n=1 Tax=Nocardia blacklockiae TaxID=480036 RepID=UPI0018931C88|nr:TetR/AcrR family transcriptional regulator [Nocardia blacklockiae]MBF6173682.1 TetR/AcrR family transcriptional regulator [Nocardia blacklockiae]
MRHDARQNRERILAAAASVFGEQGAAGSTEEVARRAGVGVATVFRHFPTKADLLEATLLAHFSDLGSRADELAAGDDAWDALRTLIRVMIETGATKLTLASLLDADGRMPASVRSISRDLRGKVDAVLSRAREDGSVRSAVTVDEIYLLIRGLAQASASQPTDAETLSRAIDIVLAGIRST